MKKVLLALALLWSLWAWAQEIQDFYVGLKINADASLEVTERIAVFFPLPLHGIIREIPVSYRITTGERYRLRLELLDVLQDGRAASYETYREGENFVIKIGDPDVTLRGLVSYTLRYRVLRALIAYGDEVELYWNAIGTAWTMPIRQARVEIFLPPEVPKERVRFLGYQGPYGSAEPFLLTWAEDRLFGEAQDLFPGEGVTVVVRVPKEFIVLPGFGQRVIWFLADNVYAAIPLFVLLGMTFIWWRWGRDPRVGTVAPEFTPPPGIGPAEAGVLVDDQFNPQDFTAGILSLATKGWIKIRDEDRDFRLVPKASEKELTPFEEALREALLRGGGKEGPTFGELKYKLYEKIPGLRAKLFMGLVDRGFYRANPEGVRTFWRSVAIGIAILGALLLFLFSNVYLGVAVMVSGGIVFLFAPYMPRKTPKGIEALRWVLGLSEYIRRAEVDRLEFSAKEKHFEELLPYAVALGLSDLWVEKFAGVLTAPPSWYEGRGPWVPTVFPARLILFHQLSRGAATAVPRTARGKGGPFGPARGFGGWTGGSGFGGRGFSGGGMGGGGGRAW